MGLPGSGIELKPPRRFYVLHSGMNDPNASAAQRLQKQLLAHGVKAGDMLVMPTPYPSLSADYEDFQAYSKKFVAYQKAVEAGDETAMPPKMSGHQYNTTIFQDSANPESKVSQTAFAHYQRLLEEAKVTDVDDIVWVGHSAGGQMGTTVAKLAAEKGVPKVDTVITLGSPVAADNAPKETRVIRYTSSGDWVLSTSDDTVGYIATGQKLTTTSLKPDDNDFQREFPGVGHSAWPTQKEVVASILKDADPSVKSPEEPKPTVMLASAQSEAAGANRSPKKKSIFSSLFSTAKKSEPPKP